MNSTVMDTIKALIEHKKYSAITEYAKILHNKDNLIVSEYGGSNVRLYKDNDNKVKLLCPKKMDTVMEGHVANAIANGSVFDDADTIDTNAACIERLSIPHDAMINSGKELPQHLKPMISIVIGRMDDNGSFDPSDADRTNGINFIHDLASAKRDGVKINGVIDNYVEREPNGFYTPDIGRGISKLDHEMDEINDTDPGDVVSDDDTVDSYEGVNVDDVESENNDEQPEEDVEVELGNETDSDEEEEDVEEPVEDDTEEDVPEDEEDVEEPVEECGENCNSGNKPIVQEDGEEVDAVDDSGATEQMGEDVGETEAVEEGVPNPIDAIKAQKALNNFKDKDNEVGQAFLRKMENSENQWSVDDLVAASDEIDRKRAGASTAEVEEAAVDQNLKGATETGTMAPTNAPMSAETKSILNSQKHYQEAFFSKQPKKLKPINRDVVAYITVEMNNIHSANDQAMLSGYTCSKIEMVDWYITVIDTQDPKYIVPHTRQYLVTLKAQLESLLAQILKIRPINRSEQIWRVNYPQASY